MRRLWIKQEYEIIKDLYQFFNLDSYNIGLFLFRSAESVNNKRKRLSIKRPKDLQSFNKSNCQRGDKNANWRGGKIKTYCSKCGEILYVKRSVLRPNNYCSDECRLSRTLGLNPNWKGGKSFEKYPVGWNEILREDIRERDNRKCVLCGISESDLKSKLDVHHIDSNKNNLDKRNLVSLCRVCHSSIRNLTGEKLFKHYDPCWSDYYESGEYLDESYGK